MFGSITAYKNNQIVIRDVGNWIDRHILTQFALQMVANHDRVIVRDEAEQPILDIRRTPHPLSA